jgi:hypothetical protein
MIRISAIVLLAYLAAMSVIVITGSKAHESDNSLMPCRVYIGHGTDGLSYRVVRDRSGDLGVCKIGGETHCSELLRCE